MVIITGKSVSEALILESVNPQYDERLFIKFPEKYKFRTCCVQKCFFCFCFDIQNNIYTQHVLNLYFSCNSKNNLSSYFGLKFIYSEKATKFCEISTNDLSCVLPVKYKLVEILQNFVAFLE